MQTNVDRRYEGAWCDLAVGLCEAGAILTPESDHPLVVGRRRGRRAERGFVLPGGGFSPYYFDFRTSDHPTKPGPLTPEIVELAARCLQYVELRECRRRCEAIAGVPFAGNPFAKALADISGSDVEPITLDKTPTPHIASLRRRIPSRVRRVLVVENVVTGAGSALRSIDVLRKVRLEVVDCIALADHERGGYERLLGCGCELHSVFAASQLFQFLSSAKKIRWRTNERIQHYIRR